VLYVVFKLRESCVIRTVQCAFSNLACVHISSSYNVHEVESGVNQAGTSGAGGSDKSNNNNCFNAVCLANMFSVS